jgi:hypothetical protein
MKGSTSQAKLDQKEERKTRRVGVVVGGYVVFLQHEVCCVCMPVKKGLGEGTIIITYTSKNSKTPNLFLGCF